MTPLSFSGVEAYHTILPTAPCSIDPAGHKRVGGSKYTYEVVRIGVYDLAH